MAQLGDIFTRAAFRKGADRSSAVASAEDLAALAASVPTQINAAVVPVYTTPALPAGWTQPDGDRVWRVNYSLGLIRLNGIIRKAAGTPFNLANAHLFTLPDVQPWLVLPGGSSHRVFTVPAFKADGTTKLVPMRFHWKGDFGNDGKVYFDGPDAFALPTGEEWDLRMGITIGVTTNSI